MSSSQYQQNAGTQTVRSPKVEQIHNLVEVLSGLRLPAVLQGPTVATGKTLSSPQINWTLISLVESATQRTLNALNPPDMDVDWGDDFECCDSATAESNRHWHVPFSCEDLCTEVRNSNEPTAVFKRLHELFPDIWAMELACNYLCDCDLLVVDDTPAIILAPNLQHLVAPIEHFLGAWRSFDEEGRITLAKMINDWHYVNAVAPTEESKRKAEECQKEWKAYVKQCASDGLDRTKILALGHLGELAPYLEDALSNEYNSEVALDFVQDNPQWCGRVQDLFHRSKSGSRLAAYLVHHGYKAEEVITQLAGRDGCSNKAVRLALHTFPHLLPVILREALRLRGCHDHMPAAAVLALLDRPWCWDELAAVLRESDDQFQTAVSRMILRHATNPRVRELASDWETAHQCDPSTEGFLETSLALTIFELSEHVNRVRDQVPDP